MHILCVKKFKYKYIILKILKKLIIIIINPFIYIKEYLTIMSFSEIKLTVFNPLLTTKESIKEFLKGYPAGTAHAQDKQLIIHLGSNNFKEIDISNKPASFFI